MSQPDRLYHLLPVIYRQRDAEQGYPLRDLLRVITEQVDGVETNIDQLYENWFIETCEDWVVPYIGDLIGYSPVHAAGQPGNVHTPQGRKLNQILIPRREVANTLRYRRRKGTLALLEKLANDVAGLPARAVEFYKLLGWTQHLNHLRPQQGRTVDLRQRPALELLDSPFEQLAHTIDVRHIQSPYDAGRYNLPNVGVFLWRLRAYSVTQKKLSVYPPPAYCLEEVSPNCYTFSVLGNDVQLYNRPQPESDPTHIADELNLPVPIRRQAFQQDHQQFLAAREQHWPYNSLYYGEDKSLQIWVGRPQQTPLTLQKVPFHRVLPADLTDWQYTPPPGVVAVDPVLGRMVFPPRQLPKGGVWVTYHYGFSADIGGGEYDRPQRQPAQHTLYQVGTEDAYPSLNAAIAQWQTDQENHPDQEAYRHAVVEVTDSGVYTEQLDLRLSAHQSLQIRAANYTRPVIRLLDYQTEATDSLRVIAQPGSRLVLEGLLITGRGVQIQRAMPDFLDTPAPESVPSSDNALPPIQVSIRHCTLVPGWTLHCDCEPKRPAEPSLELFNLIGCVEIEHSIIGSIQINQDEAATDPLTLRVSDSILDATALEQMAIDAPGCPVAYARLTILRSTVLGQIQVHGLDLAENCIFMSQVLVASRQQGCVRFCYVPPGSRTPRRYRCQPDLVEQAIAERFKQAVGTDNAIAQEQAKTRERDRVRPQFNSIRYGTPTYCQLAQTCAEEIQQGADDESEMGAFHDLFHPQRLTNLRTRLDEYTPAGMETGIIYAS
ncbi:MAG: hypothetical protein AAFX78_04445 [Cyanobacteria bacterium J06638_20]